LVNPKSAFQNSETLTLSADAQSTAVDCRYYDRFSYQLDWSGLATTTSTIIPQVSNDGSTWADLENIWDTVKYTLDATSGTQVWIFTEAPARYVRLKYTAETNTTGTGTLLFEGQRFDL
jgi:hypothetical protein